jgi:methylmalonyl-CoA/ethylmalonyl-CoA epimerase
LRAGPLGGKWDCGFSEEIMIEFIHHIAYVTNDMDDALRIFHNTLELELINRKIIEGRNSVEIAVFRCGSTFIEVLRPINHPALATFLQDHGPGLHHVSFAIKDLSKGVEELTEKGVVVNDPFTASTGWKIAYFNFEKSDLDIFKSCYHGDHLTEINLY